MNRASCVGSLLAQRIIWKQRGFWSDGITCLGSDSALMGEKVRDLLVSCPERERSLMGTTSGSLVLE